MKIGIYGDSFTACGVDHLRWGTLLQKKYSVNIHGSPATSLDWSVLQFDNTQAGYDKIIFIATQPERLYIPNHPQINHWTAYSQSENLINNLSKHERKHFQQFIEFYIKYMIDDNTMDLKKKTLINYIRSTRPDALIIPAIQNTVPDSKYISLTDISLLDVQDPKLGISLQIYEKQYGGDIRPCHMNATNNVILFEKIAAWLTTGKFVFDTIDDFFIAQNPVDFLTVNNQFVKSYRSKQHT